MPLYANWEYCPVPVGVGAVFARRSPPHCKNRAKRVIASNGLGTVTNAEVYKG